MKSTSIITRKQAGVIYSNVKRGTVTMSKAAISAMYDVAGIDTRDFVTSGTDAVRDMVERLLLAVDAIFANDLDAAQAELDAFSAAYAA